MVRIHILFLLLAGVPALGQVTLSTKSKKAIDLYTEADNFRVRGQYQQALALLDQAIEKDKNFAEAYYRKGLVFFSTRQFERAIENFEKGLQLTSDQRKHKVYWYDLGESHLNIGEYEQAVTYLTRFIEAEPQNSRKRQQAQLLLSKANFGVKNKDAAAAYKLRPLSDIVNRFAMQYFPVVTADEQELIFTRRLGNGEEHDEDIVISRKNAQGQWTAPVSISDNINTRYNEGTCAVSADGRRLIFTSCLGRSGYGSCDLYQSERVGKEWSVPVNLGPNVNTGEWESQPSLSADGRTLYFVSDRRGGYGRRDIWISKMNDEGQWTKAVNAGKPVNTEHDEISPFIHVNNKTLYYASNGLPGFGGYDLFYVQRPGNGTWSAPKNIGPPINTHEDQFSLFITADGEKGYYVHEEMSSQGFSAGKIFEMEIPREHQIEYKSNYVKGVITDKETNQTLRARIELINLQSDEVESIVQSDSITGEYLIVLTQGAEYALFVNKKGYLFQSQYFNYSEVKDFEPIVLNVALDKVKEGSFAVLKNIFFDTDKYELKEKSVSELKKIQRFLEENPSVRVEISGHTDNVGTESYNKQLSERRAQSVYNYLIETGIDPKRLTPRGFGSTKPIASNDTDEGRQMNRRIEFRVIK